MQCYVTLYCTALYYTAIYCTMLYYTVPYHTIPYHTTCYNVSVGAWITIFHCMASLLQSRYWSLHFVNAWIQFWKCEVLSNQLYILVFVVPTPLTHWLRPTHSIAFKFFATITDMPLVTNCSTLTARFMTPHDLWLARFVIRHVLCLCAMYLCTVVYCTVLHRAVRYCAVL